MAIYEPTNAPVPLVGQISRGRVTSHNRWLDGRAYTATITAFDAQNRPTSLTSPAGESITIGYDWFGENYNGLEN